MQPRDLSLQSDLSAPTPAISRQSVRSRTLATAVLLSLSLVAVSMLGRYLWSEWQNLLGEEEAAAASAVVGYPNIYPRVSRAAKPVPSLRVEGDRVLVWSGWQSGRGHAWFTLGRDECDPATLGDPVGRDVAQAIDYPAVETSGGPIWERIPAAADVVGLSVGKTRCAYPMTVLAKVLVVNDVVDGTPYLLHLDPFMGPEDDVAIYDPRIEGHRITLGSTGFSVRGHHVLYDRGTESLWTENDDALVSFSGPHKGKKLTLVRHLRPQAWSEWKDENPESRLLVGSLDRTAGLPSD